MTPLFSRDQVRRIDANAVEKYGISGIVLMENAARAVAAEALAILGDLGSAPLAVIVCGGGNNGGDGFAVARHLHLAGVSVSIYLVSDPAKLKGDAATNFTIVENMNLKRVEIFTGEHFDSTCGEWRNADILIDAILGTGFSGELKPHVARIIERINSLSGRTPILAVDVPSGLDCDTGIPAKPTVKADVTVTFVAPKIGFASPAAHAHLGRVVVAGIGAPIF